MTAFDYILQVTDQTAGTVTLTTSPFQVKEYQPRAEDRDAPTVGETIEVRLTDGSPAANLAEVRTLNNLLKQAEKAQEGRNVNRVYLTWQENASADVYRSEILQGRAEWENTALKWDHWTNNTQFANIFIERRNHWEGAEVQIPLTNPNGTANTSGLRVYNDNCGTGSGTAYHYNYIDVAGTSIDGDLPAPVKFEFTPITAGAPFWVFEVTNNVNSAGTTAYWFETPSGSANITGNNVAKVAAAGGTAFLGTIAAGTAEARLTYPFTAQNYVDFGGNYARVSVDAIGSTDVIWRFRTQTTLYQNYSPYMYWDPADTYLLHHIDLGVLHFPAPSGIGTSAVSDDGIYLYLYPTSGAGGTICVDALRVQPVDYYVKYDFLAEFAKTTDTYIYVDPYEDDYYVGKTGGTIYRVGGFGIGDLRLEPEKDQRLMICFFGGGNDVTYLYTAAGGNIKMWYRPRRLTL